MRHDFRFSAAVVGALCSVCLYAISQPSAAQESPMTTSGVFVWPLVSATALSERDLSTVRALGVPGGAAVPVLTSETVSVRLWDEIKPPTPGPQPQQAAPTQNGNVQRSTISVLRR